MSDKRIPVYVGEGEKRIKIGRAQVEQMPDGTSMVNISIDNPDWGQWSIAGFEPMRLTGIIPPIYVKPTG